MKQHHQQLEQLINAARYEMATLFQPMSKVIERVPQEELSSKRRNVQDEEAESSIVALHDLMKAKTELELLDKTKGELIFPITPPCSDYSTSVIWALEQLLGIRTLDAQVEFVNRRLLLGRTDQTVIRFLNRAHGRVHDAVLRNFLKAFLARSLNLMRSLCSLIGQRSRKWSLLSL